MRTRIAYLNLKTGKIRVNPMIEGDMRKRILEHEREYLRLRRKGWGFTSAVKGARRVEHRGMTRHQIQVYEGTIGAMTRLRLKSFR